MRKTLTNALAVTFALACASAAPLAAQMAPDMLQGSGKPGDVAAGTYAIDPDHTQVAFAVSHLGISPYMGDFSGAHGTLTVDPARPDQASVVVTLPVASVHTASAKLTDELKSADWLDAGKYPEATFRSTAVRTRDTGAAIEGMLTLHGVTKPVTIHARFFGAGINPMSKKASVGFVARMTIKRSDFGVSKYIPLVSDETLLVINAAFQK